MKDPRAETIQEVDGILSYEGLPTYSELAEGLRLLLGTAATAEAAKGEQAADALLARVFVGQHPQAEKRVTPGGGLPGDHNGTKLRAIQPMTRAGSEAKLTLTGVSRPDLLTLARLLGGDASAIPEGPEGATYTFEITMPVPGASTPWRPIDTAPKNGRTILLGYYNRAGKWRTVRGQWMSADYIAEQWEDPDSGEPGWFETSEEAEDVPNCWPIDPTRWMPLPEEPGTAPVPGGAPEQDQEAAR